MTGLRVDRVPATDGPVAPGVEDTTLVPGLVLTVANTGEQQVEPVVRVEFHDARGGIFGPAVPVPVVPMLPGATLERRVALPALPAGRYSAVAVLEWGGGDEVIVRRVPVVVQSR